MKNSIRCCISCILPCGALDVVRIVHSNGLIEEISGSIMAAEIMKAHPKHVLKLPSSPSHDGMLSKVVVVPPDAKLQCGKIYFLLPLPPTTMKKRGQNANHNGRQHRQSRSTSNTKNNTILVANLSTSDEHCFSEVLADKLSTERDRRRRGRVGMWRPHLESISETLNNY
ncbi:hypothetical protein Gotri_010121 [Gossypium trilobum]|uniref:Uncharacterized protein n=1 Tax=Gossypium trilobum TaxID=34281 RepID=A0A7J9EQE9_9ROSI|nr:hypothetical protein [Gossypium trilobum]